MQNKKKYATLMLLTLIKLIMKEMIVNLINNNDWTYSLILAEENLPKIQRIFVKWVDEDTIVNFDLYKTDYDKSNKKHRTENTNLREWNW